MFFTLLILVAVVVRRYFELIHDVPPAPRRRGADVLCESHHSLTRKNEVQAIIRRREGHGLVVLVGSLVVDLGTRVVWPLRLDVIDHIAIIAPHLPQAPLLGFFDHAEGRVELVPSSFHAAVRKRVVQAGAEAPDAGPRRRQSNLGHVRQELLKRRRAKAFLQVGEQVPAGVTGHFKIALLVGRAPHFPSTAYSRLIRGYHALEHSFFLVLVVNLLGQLVHQSVIQELVQLDVRVIHKLVRNPFHGGLHEILRIDVERQALHLTFGQPAVGVHLGWKLDEGIHLIKGSARRIAFPLA
mmetsp:Transcript_14372/g.40882  ORF Transcript_14372/g.40882 Transcript_14372/m.40882 type:complete len:297 (+) Transcript_14372:35-925(+)